MPLAVNLDRVNRMTNFDDVPHSVSAAIHKKYDCDISFVGAMYNEKHNLYERLDNLPQWVKGYLDGIMAAQLKVYGDFFIERLLTKESLQNVNVINYCH